MAPPLAPRIPSPQAPGTTDDPKVQSKRGRIRTKARTAAPAQSAAE